MTRITVDLDAQILRELQRIQRCRRTSIGRLVAELLAEALEHRRNAGATETPAFAWIARAMEARVDFADKEQLWPAL